MSKKSFTRSDGYTEADLLQAGLDHTTSAIELLNFGPFALDSAGYLAQLGVELILKTILLSRTDSFPDEHRLFTLLDLANAAGPPIKLSEPQQTALRAIDRFYQLRYPVSGHAASVGTEDFRPLIALVPALLGCLPPATQALVATWRQPDPGGHFRKAGRIAAFRPRKPKV
jgi:hypothetical protein